MGAKEERTRSGGTTPAVECTQCGFTWHTAAMVEGLRLLGSCPRCHGELEFASEASTGAEEPAVGSMPPHLALGLPRPPRRD